MQKVTLSLDKTCNERNACNGLAIWMDWHLDENTIISDGPSAPIKIGHDISWYTHAKQGVFLFSHLQNYSLIQCNDKIEVEVLLDLNEGDLKFSIK